MKCSMTGFVISKDHYEFAGGKGVKVFFQETYDVNGKEKKQNVPVKIWHSTHGHDLAAFSKGAHMTLHGHMDFRRFRKGGDGGPWTDDIAFELISFEVLPYEKKGESDGGF